MAQWDKFGWNGNVDDRRGLKRGGGLGIVGILLAVGLGYFVFGQSPIDTLGSMLSNGQINLAGQQISDQEAEQFKGNDAYEMFARAVLGSTDETWKKRFAEKNMRYKSPTLVLFRGQTQSGCGGASSATGPHYCPADSKIYLDETFFDRLQQLDGSKGDLAQGYVIAHEVGHHVQNLTDQLGGQTRERAIAIELQADCYAGVWAHDIKGKGILEAGDIDEALQSAEAVGDDHIQKTTQGRVTPEDWTHGSSAERKGAFLKGYQAGTMSACRQL